MNHTGQDPFIGLDVGGTLFYCFASTLTNNSHYFCRRLGGNMDPGPWYQDDKGRKVYCIDRDADTFHYILSFMRTPNGLPTKLPPFSECPLTWRALRKEAEFFGIDALSELLQVIFTCSPETHKSRGIFYWLGTNKGKEPYENPHSRGEVHVGGWVDMPEFQGDIRGDDAFSVEESRKMLVQYRPKAMCKNRDSRFGGGLEVRPVHNCHLLWCDHGVARIPVVIEMLSISVKPTHLSIRSDIQCFDGMTGCKWNFEGSINGHEWDILFQFNPSDDATAVRFTQEELEQWKKNDEPAVPSFFTDIVEHFHRHTWPIEPPPNGAKYYRYFRIIGADSDGCLHGLGLEIYGDACEPK